MSKQGIEIALDQSKELAGMIRPGGALRLTAIFEVTASPTDMEAFIRWVEWLSSEKAVELLLKHMPSMGGIRLEPVRQTLEYGKLRQPGETRETGEPGDGTDGETSPRTNPGTAGGPELPPGEGKPRHGHGTGQGRGIRRVPRMP